ncbi:MAG: secondary thiamine-phosphate synthase enzyme YjbQ [Cyclobacteriaceae bacterium]|nr:secondary thiamine-phosphate synthase enzyme YjbQ [Cyclobacteriaceae bacterium]
MNRYQTLIQVKASSRGFHLITDQVKAAIRAEIKDISAGLLHVFIQHTSASLTINENCDPDVRADFESHFNKSVPENAPYYLHTLEGPDDMPAHIKASILGPSLQIPIMKGQLALGTWQGIYLCEHRDRPTVRTIVLTII